MCVSCLSILEGAYKTAIKRIASYYGYVEFVFMAGGTE